MKSSSENQERGAKRKREKPNVVVKSNRFFLMKVDQLTLISVEQDKGGKDVL